MNVIVFGATGMVGQGVLRECLLNDEVEKVLVIGRTPTGEVHAKLRELVRTDMFDFSIDRTALAGFDACFFCLGVSSAGMNEDDYTHLTYDLTIGWARTLAKVNQSLTFIYVSGAGTGGSVMWARVKGRTEDEIMSLFPSSYMIRLGALRPMHGELSKTRWTRIAYSLLRPLIPVVRFVAPDAIITTEELGRAMIRLARNGHSKKLLNNKDLRSLGNADFNGPAGENGVR